MDCLKHTSKVINVDQPKGDVFNQSTEFFKQKYLNCMTKIEQLLSS